MQTKKLNIPLTVFIPVFAIGSILMAFPGLLLGPQASKAAGLALITIGLFATGCIPEYLTTLLFFLIAMLFHVAPAAIIFSGFQSTALWLVFGGLVLGVAIRTTGLGQRIADKLAGYLAGGYPGLIAGMTLVGFAFAFIMPSSMGRIILLIPIALALAEHFGFHAGSNGRTGLVLATALGSFIPAFSILPANVPNMILAGLAETQLKISLLYGEYLLLHFPVLGLLKASVIVITILWMYPDRLTPDRDAGSRTATAMTREQKILAATLALLLLLWLTDFAHHISPAWISLGGAVFLLLPKVGVVNTEFFNTRINYASIFFVAGILGLGAMIMHSGLGADFGKALIAALPLSPDTPFINYMSASMAASLVGLLTTQPGIPAVLTPLSPELAQATGFSIKSVVMLLVPGVSTLLIPYQAPPLIVAMQLSGEKLWRVFKPIIVIALITYAVLLPLNYLWWRLLGWI